MKTKSLLALIIMSLTLFHCSSKVKKQEVTSQSQITSTPVNLQTPPTPATPSAPPTPVSTTSKELAELKESIKKAEAVTLKKEEATHNNQQIAAQPNYHQHHKPDGIPADKALGWLKNGNTRYLKGFLRNDGMKKKDIEKLSHGQTPHSIILSCSDSRVPPELVFDQKLGEVFTVRTAGQSLDSSALASIEYAIEHLGSRLLVVMGHTSCGAVKAAHSFAPGADVGSPYLNALVADIQPRIATKLNAKASDSFIAEGWDNTKGAAKALIEKSKIIREAVKSGQLRIESALYHLKSGEVEWAR